MDSKTPTGPELKRRVVLVVPLSLDQSALNNLIVRPPNSVSFSDDQLHSNSLLFSTTI